MFVFVPGAVGRAGGAGHGRLGGARRRGTCGGAERGGEVFVIVRSLRTECGSRSGAVDSSAGDTAMDGWR